MPKDGDTIVRRRPHHIRKEMGWSIQGIGMVRVTGYPAGIKDWKSPISALAHCVDASASKRVDASHWMSKTVARYFIVLHYLWRGLIQKVYKNAYWAVSEKWNVGVIVNTCGWLWNSKGFFVSCFCSLLWPWPRTKPDKNTFFGKITNQRFRVMHSQLTWEPKTNCAR